MATDRWKRRPEGSNWGDFGVDDQLGRLNLLTVEKVLQGIAEVREGRTFCLSLPLDYPGGNRLNPQRFAPMLSPTGSADQPRYNYPRRIDNPVLTDIVCDDKVEIVLQYSTQWDSFAHVGELFDVDGDGRMQPVYYNGFRAGKDVIGIWDYEANRRLDGPTGARRLGIENMAATGVQGRAVMIDLHANFGQERHCVGYDELMSVMAKDKVTVEPGDMLCLHTGYSQAVLDMKRDPDPQALQNAFAVLDGRDPRLLQWITDSGISVIAADNYGVEQLPARPGSGTHYAAAPLHEHCLFKLGIHLGELWYLTDLARWLRERRRSRFLLTAPPLRLPGAVGSPATPIATV